MVRHWWHQRRRYRCLLLLTVTGEIAKFNRGPLDPALGQMMHQQKLDFDKAFTFDFAALAALPAVDICPTLEYDNKPMPLGGPGSLWAVYDADRFADMAERPVSARFSLCLCGIYYSIVRKG